VLDIPLVLPLAGKPNNNVWVARTVCRGDNVFGQYRELKSPRIITGIVKKIHSQPSSTLTDENGDEVTEDNPVWDFLNPPKAWMTDSAEELMSMYATAKESRGDVLVGGLGMGIFPQMSLYLDRPVKSFTIVDNCPEIIDITSSAWLDNLKADNRNKIHLVTQSFEDFIKTGKSNKKFDTIFADLWEDADPRFLPYMNLLVEHLKPLCNTGGRIFIWAYALAVDAFVQMINFFESSDIDIRKIPVPIDPLLSQYGLWRALPENQNLSIDAYEKKARELALTVKLTDFKFDREKYFTPHYDSITERVFVMQILSAARKEV
ncbi:MAG: hypothetical protein GY757_61330, partial [bacterium]|nr:hypothetical protein [bacterium]